MDEKIITGNLKKLRLQRGITLQTLALKTGLTKGYLSKVERSEKAPPYSTLTKIVSALGTEVTTILSKTMSPATEKKLSLSRGKDRKIIKGTSQFSGYDYEVLVKNKPGKNMEPFIIHSPWKIDKRYSHEGEEFIYVMEGAIEFLYGDESYILEKGDNIYFDACVPHCGISLGDERARLMVVIYFYKRNRQ